MPPTFNMNWSTIVLTGLTCCCSCQRGSAYVVDHAAELWPAMASSSPLPAMKDVQICGTPDADEVSTAQHGRATCCSKIMQGHAVI